MDAGVGDEDWTDRNTAPSHLPPVPRGVTLIRENGECVTKALRQKPDDPNFPNHTPTKTHPDSAPFCTDCGHLLMTLNRGQIHWIAYDYTIEEDPL